MFLNRYFHKKRIDSIKKEDILLIPVALIHFSCGSKQKMDHKMTPYGSEQRHEIDQRVITTLKKTIKQKFLSQSL